LLILLVCLVALTGAVHAQPNIYLGFGPSLHSDLPHGAVNVTLGIPTGDKTTLLVNYSARGTIDDLKQNQLVYKSSAGVREVMATANAGKGVVEFFLLGDVGGVIAPNATGFAGASGGGLTYHPGRAPNWGISGAIQGEYSPVNPGWRKNVFLQFGYNFRGK
jgi:hypothetical protein